MHCSPPVKFGSEYQLETQGDDGRWSYLEFKRTALANWAMGHLLPGFVLQGLARTTQPPMVAETWDVRKSLIPPLKKNASTQKM